MFSDALLNEVTISLTRELALEMFKEKGAILPVEYLTIFPKLRDQKRGWFVTFDHNQTEFDQHFMGQFAHNKPLMVFELIEDAVAWMLRH